MKPQPLIKALTPAQAIDWKRITDHINGDLIPIPYKCPACKCRLYRLGYHHIYHFFIIGLICPRCQRTWRKPKA
jgi:hypothetical protein